MKTNQLISTITHHVSEAKTLKAYNETVFQEDIPLAKNKFLFFIKPELTIDKKGIDHSAILELIFKKLEQFKLGIQKVSVVNAAYLNKHHIISMHYGVINRMSGNIGKYITSEGKKNFKEIYGIEFDEANVYGSLEILEKYPFLSPMALSMIWQNASFNKLAGGTYAAKLKFDGSSLYLVNGFHPRQLEHFTTPGRSIVVMTVSGDIDWTAARNELIGKTNPADASEGSIRKELLNNKESYGLEEVSSSWNGVHLSAGPIEGLIELMRYNSDFENHICQVPSDYAYGQKLIDTLGEEKLDKLLRNPVVTFEGKTESVFDLTEEMNADECLNLLSKITV